MKDKQLLDDQKDVLRAVSLEDLTVIEVGKYFLGDRVRKQAISSNYKGLCPFHIEKTPSFYLKKEKNYFVCYGCGEYGGPFKLLTILSEDPLLYLSQNFSFENKELKQALHKENVKYLDLELCFDQEPIFEEFYNV